jgi:hypothetical protein
MGDVKEQAAKAAREYNDNQGIAMRHPFDVFVIGYTSGHASGVEEGARAFAEWAWRDSGDIRIREYWDDLAARFLATRPEFAGGTTPEPHCGWAPGHYDNTCCVCGEVFHDSDKRAVCCLPCADKELATGTGSAENENNSPDRDKE